MAAKLTKIIQKVFGSTASAGQRGVIGSKAAGAPTTTTDPTTMQSLSNYLQGWFGCVLGVNSPAIEDMNSLHFLITRQLSYLMQTGLAEWDAVTEYFVGSLVNDGTGAIYKSLIDNNINNPVTDKTKWSSPLDEKMALLAASNWVITNPSQANQWFAIAYGNNTFVSVASTGTNRAMTSPDGDNWVMQTINANSWNKVAFGAGVFLAISDGIAAGVFQTSPDGVTWTNRTPSQNQQWRGVCFGGGQFVVVSFDNSNKFMTSPDGITWTTRTVTPTGAFKDVAYGNGLYVAVGSSGTDRLASSSDGITWTARTQPATGTWNSVVYGNGIWVAVGDSGTYKIMTSTDGITWTGRTADASDPSPTFQAIEYGAGIFVAIGNSGNVQTSVDGINWTYRQSVFPYGFRDCAYGRGRFVGASSHMMVSLSNGF